MEERLKTQERNRTVYIVGAGPGDKDLLTIKAYKIIRSADVIIHDYLVPKGIIGLAPKSCELISHKHDSTPKERMEMFKECILRYYPYKTNIVRLQVGDPFLFGRGAEEIEFLRNNKIKYEVIPGITSALGIPASIGLPVTNRKHSSAVVIVNGHALSENEVNWKAVATIKGTIIILMGISTIDKIVSGLIHGGMDPHMPACVISKGTLEDQRVAFSALRELGNTIRESSLMPPALIVIGNVVSALRREGVPRS